MSSNKIQSKKNINSICCKFLTKFSLYSSSSSFIFTIIVFNLYYREKGKGSVCEFICVFMCRSIFIKTIQRRKKKNKIQLYFLTKKKDCFLSFFFYFSLHNIKTISLFLIFYPFCLVNIIIFVLSERKNFALKIKYNIH